MDEDGADDAVRVVSDQGAFNRPRFIIESEGKFYLTLAVWEYDPAARDKSPDQQDGVDSVEADFRQLLETGHGRQAVQIPEWRRIYRYTGQTRY